VFPTHPLPPPLAHPAHPPDSKFALSASALHSKASKKRKSVTNADRKAICHYHLSNPAETQESIAKKYGVHKTTIGKILKNKDHWLTVELGEAFGCGRNGTGLPSGAAKHRGTQFPSIEPEMLKWLAEASDAFYDNFYSSPAGPAGPFTRLGAGPFSDTNLRQKARDIATSHNIKGFRGSAGWLQSFKKRHGIRNGLWGAYLQRRNATSSSNTASGPPGLGSVANNFSSVAFQSKNSTSDIVLRSDSMDNVSMDNVDDIGSGYNKEMDESCYSWIVNFTTEALSLGL
jgi:hypothetical protein